MAIQKAGRAVHGANLGLYLGIAPLLVPERGLSAGNNFRIFNGQVTNYNVGWSSFNNLNLDNKPVLLIEQFKPRGHPIKLILGNTTDLFQYHSDQLTYITPRYGVGTISVTNNSTTVTGSGTNWITGGIKAGDYISLGADRVTPTPSNTWYQIQSVNSATQLTLSTAYTGSTQSGQAYTIRRTFTGTIKQPWATEIFRDATAVTSGSDGDRWYATNSTDRVVAWDGITDQVYYPNIGNINTCVALRRYKNVLVYVAPTVSGTFQNSVIRTSAIGQPENVNTLEAASFILHDGATSLTAAYRLGELLAIYAEDAIYMAQFVGQPLMFVFRGAVPNYGVKNFRSVIQFLNRHLFISDDGQYFFDGVNITPHATHVWNDIARRISRKRSSLLSGFIDFSNSELIWAVPLISDDDPENGPPKTAYVGHYMENVGDYPMPHSCRDLPATAFGYYIEEDILTFDELNVGFDQIMFRWNDAQLQSGFVSILFGTASGGIYSLNKSTQNGMEPVSFIRFSRRPLVDSRKKAVITRIYPNDQFSGVGNLTINLRLFDSPNSNIPINQSEYTIPLTGEWRFAPFRASGRFVEVEFGSGPSTNGRWFLEGYDMDIVHGGER